MIAFLKKFRIVLFSLFCTLVVICVVASYSISIVSVNHVIEHIDENIGTTSNFLNQNGTRYDDLLSDFKEDYSSKTRMIAMILAKDDSYLEDDRTLEELRVTVGAELITVVDGTGEILASTDPSSEENNILDQFLGHLQSNVYTDVKIDTEAEKPVITAASSLDNGNGLVQIVYDGTSAASILEEARIINVSKNIPLYTSGISALLDRDSLKYISCSETDKIGTKCTYDAEKLSEKKGKFDVELEDGSRAMAHYQISGDYIVLAVVPYSEIYHARNLVLGWTISGGVLIMLVTLLGLRMVKKEPVQK